MVQVLLEARRLIHRHGYDRVSSARGWSLFAAVWEQESPEPGTREWNAWGVARWDARRLVETIARAKLIDWDTQPLACRETALMVLELALRQLGVEPKALHRGGHTVTYFEHGRHVVA